MRDSVIRWSSVCALLDMYVLKKVGNRGEEKTEMIESTECRETGREMQRERERDTEIRSYRKKSTNKGRERLSLIKSKGGREEGRANSTHIDEESDLCSMFTHFPYHPHHSDGHGDSHLIPPPLLSFSRLLALW